MKIGIIGGGITGLSTALALHRSGISSIVFEQAPSLNEIGAGIWLQPNAMKVMDRLGLKERIKSLGTELDKMEITNSRFVPFKAISDEVVEDEEGNRTTAIHRGKLQKLLYDEVANIAEIHLNKKYVNHSTGPGRITIQFETGEEQVDILLAADGIHSLVRKNLFKNTTLRNTGQVCWRGVSQMKLPDKLKTQGKEAWGKQIRFGFSQISKDQVYWFAVAREEHQAKADETGTKEYLIRIFNDFSPVVGELIDRTEPSAIHQAVLMDLKRLSKWYKGNICLLGDAAHATTPNMGQGACQGIEDAYYISRLLLERPDRPEEVFSLFQQKRRKKVDYIVNTSWQFGKMAHSKIGQPMMKMIFKLTPESMVRTQMNRLYSL